MLAPRKILGFAFRVLVYYGIAVALYSIVGTRYTYLFCRTSTVLFNTFSSRSHVNFQPDVHPTSSADVTILMETFKPPGKRETKLSARLTGYLPLMQVVALILASPVSWSRRLKGLIPGILLIHAFIGFRLWAISFFVFASLAPSQVGITQFTANLVAIVASPSPAFLVPPLVWLVIGFHAHLQEMFAAPALSSTR